MNDARFSDGWDKHHQIGRYHIRMSNRWGPFRAVVEVWQDVWPAVGGLMVRRRFRDQTAADQFFTEMIRTMS